MMSVPNQKIVCINKPKYQQNFLQIGVQEWQEARQAMTYSEFSFYLYLASNANGYNLEPVSYTHLDVYKRQGLDEGNEIIGYKFLKVGPYLEEIKKGADPVEAFKKHTAVYGRFNEAVKVIDPRHE